ALVRFEQHNLVDSLPPVTAVDIALCRNVFIYLDGSAQERAVGLLRTALRPGGDLLLGVTDRLPVGCGFERSATGTAVIYRKQGGST
ncbi:MAG: methyltransferase, partial [Rhodospirillaceae bacterium]|nr:methyltransferase [Rhodospirillaceae bacterium]